LCILNEILEPVILTGLVVLMLSLSFLEMIDILCVISF